MTTARSSRTFEPESAAVPISEAAPAPGPSSRVADGPGDSGRFPDVDQPAGADRLLDPVAALIVERSGPSQAAPSSGHRTQDSVASGMSSGVRLGLIDARDPTAGCVVSHPLDPIPADAVRALALTSDGRTAFIAAARSSASDGRGRPDPCLSMFDTVSGRMRASVELPDPPIDVAVTDDGSRVICATEGGIVLFRVGRDRLRAEQILMLGAGPGSGLAITPSGTVLVALPEMGCVAVLALDDAGLSDTGERIVTGRRPMAIDVCGPGAWAAVACAGRDADPADRSVVSLLDISLRPYRAVQHIALAAAPTTVALSPDGHWLAVGSTVGHPDAQEAVRPQAEVPGSGPVVAEAPGGVRLYSILPGRALEMGATLAGVPVSSLVFGTDPGCLLVATPLSGALQVLRATRDGLQQAAEPVGVGGAALALCAARGVASGAAGGAARGDLHGAADRLNPPG
jgi:hypothetical protein